MGKSKLTAAAEAYKACCNSFGSIGSNIDGRRPLAGNDIFLSELLFVAVSPTGDISFITLCDGEVFDGTLTRGDDDCAPVTDCNGGVPISNKIRYIKRKISDFSCPIQL